MYGLLVLLIYTALMLGATFMLSRKSSTAESFHVADRRLGLWQSAMSIAATWIWAPARLAGTILVSSPQCALSVGVCALCPEDAETDA